MTLKSKVQKLERLFGVSDGGKMIFAHKVENGIEVQVFDGTREKIMTASEFEDFKNSRGEEDRLITIVRRESAKEK